MVYTVTISNPPHNATRWQSPTSPFSSQISTFFQCIPSAWWYLDGTTLCAPNGGSSRQHHVPRKCQEGFGDLRTWCQLPTNKNKALTVIPWYLASGRCCSWKGIQHLGIFHCSSPKAQVKQYQATVCWSFWLEGIACSAEDFPAHVAHRNGKDTSCPNFSRCLSCYP